LRSLALVAGALLCLGCQKVSNVDDLEIVVLDVPDSQWGCLSTSSPTETKDVVHYQGSVSFVPSNEPVRDVTVRLCETDDDADNHCSRPVLPAIHSADGLVEFDVVGTFNGYIELSSPNALPAVIEIWRPLGRMRVLPELKMLKPETLTAFATIMQEPIVPGLGHAMFWVEDCHGKRAAGGRVRVVENDGERAAQLSPSTNNYYAVDGRLPSVSVDETDGSGGGGIINLPPTFWTFEGLLASDERRIANFAARIRADQVTTFIVEPD
jgi:hypothetical protein